MAARPETNLLQTAIDQQLGVLLPSLSTFQVSLQSVATERANAQLDAHRRVRRRDPNERAHRRRAGASGGYPRRLRSVAEVELTWRGALRTSRPSAPRAACFRRTCCGEYSTPTQACREPQRKTTILAPRGTAQRGHHPVLEPPAQALGRVSPSRSKSARGCRRDKGPYQREVEPATATRVGVRLPAGDRRARAGRPHFSHPAFLRSGPDPSDRLRTVA